MRGAICSRLVLSCMRWPLASCHFVETRAAGASVPYHFVGDDDDKFRLDFSYKDPVRVKGTVDYDAEGNPALVSVAEVERLQTELPLPEPEHR
jgi:hypothetical protein